MDPIAHRTLSDLLDDVAAATPAPGGGTSAAITCALAAGLLEMTAEFGARRTDARRPNAEKALGEIGRRAVALRAEALELAERELTSYAPVLEALRLPAVEPGRQRQLDAALSEASEAPLALALVAAELAELSLDAQRAGTGHLHGDALTCLLLAEAACQTAARLVDINLGSHPDDPRRREAKGARRRASAARAEALRAESA
jgi:methenyltetrahydrofolate cyclohydrolase